MSDPDVWRHLPSGRHTSPEKTREGIDQSVAHWARDGLGYWTARLREDLADAGLSAGSVVGTGGCAVRAGDTCRRTPSCPHLASSARGPGGGHPGIAAGMDAAHAVDPDRPVIAYLLEHNRESRGRAESAGLQLVWRGPDAGNPDPEAVRLVYADRPLDAEVLDRVTTRP
jgi:hypothetical protein